MSSMNVQPLRALRSSNVQPAKGKLVRQNGCTNLAQKNALKSHDANVFKVPAKDQYIKTVVPETTSSFEVFCDSPDDKNIIHQLEKHDINEKKRRALSTISTTCIQEQHCIKSKLYAVPTKSIETSSCATSVYEDACSSVYGSALESPSRPCSPTEEPSVSVSDNSKIQIKNDFSDVYYLHSDFSRDVYNYMKQRELIGRPNSRYMIKQTDINPQMRTILVDWMADVCCEYTLQLDTLCLGVNILDRILCLRMVSRLKLQLLGAAALMVASKFEEIFPPELKEFIYVTDETYTADQLIKMEKVILNALQFEVSTPLSSWFATRLAHLGELDKRSDLLVSYLVELSVLEMQYLQFLPSMIGAASVCAARIICGSDDPWSDELLSHSNYTVDEIMPCVRTMLRSFRDAPHATLTGIYAKYADPLRLSVSTMPCPVEQCVDSS